MNNLRQIGLALNQHQEANGRFPAGFGAPRFPEEPWDVSYLFQVLPYIEQSPLYNSVNIEAELLYGNENSTANYNLPTIFLCPSDTSRSSTLARNTPNYAANCGMGYPFKGDGPFVGKPLGPRHIVDGLSQTVGVSEWVVGSGYDGRFTGSPDVADRKGTIYLIKTPVPGFEDFSRKCEEGALGQYQITEAFKGNGWLRAGLGVTIYNPTLTPNRPSCISRSAWEAVSAGSHHGDGANSLRLDGGVFFARATIQPRVWQALGSRAGGEIVQALP